MRRMLDAGIRPAKEAIRTGELINYLTWDYLQPGRKATSFWISTELRPAMA